MIQRMTGFRSLVRSLRVGSSSPTKLGAHYYFSSGATSSTQQICKPSPYRIDVTSDLIGYSTIVSMQRSPWATNILFIIIVVTFCFVPNVFIYIYIRTLSACLLFYDLDSPNVGDDEYADVEWDNLGFGIVPTDYIYIMKSSIDNNFEGGQLYPYGNIQLSPAAAVLSYGQGIYEGTKVYRKEDGRLLMFRPDENAIRMRIGAERMCMPSPSIHQFVNAIKQIALTNKRWVPPTGKGSLYIRPVLIGSGPTLGLAPAPEYTFLVYASPVRNYFKDGFAALNLCIEEEYDRASRGGTGGVKSITNYAPVLKAMTRAKNRGFSDVLYLDSVNNKFVEEVSSCNVFIVKDNVISTPTAAKTILAGITRKSVIEIAGDHGYQVEERSIGVNELMEADEVFCTGTAVGVAPVGSITYKNTRKEFKTGIDTICPILYSTLMGIKTGIIEDKKGWVVVID